MQHIVKRKRLCKQFEEQAIMYGIDVLDTTFVTSKKKGNELLKEAQGPSSLV